MKKYLATILLLVGVVMLFSGCTQKNTVEIVKKESFYSDFTVEGNKVYIKCELAVDNSTGQEATVEFYADFPDDVNIGLLTSARLMGYQENGGTSEFSLAEGKQRVVVVFIGDFAGTNQKHDRNLPNITLVRK